MSVDQCRVCLGSRIIRLPLYAAAASVDLDGAKLAPGETHRTYPCPECAPGASIERVKTFEVSAIERVDVRLQRDKNYNLHVRRSTANRLVDQMLDGGVIDYFTRPAVDHHGLPVCALVAKVAVISIADRKSIEARIAEHQEAVAAEVVEEAIKGINVWGSAHGQITIDKDQARSSVRHALRVVLERRAK